MPPQGIESNHVSREKPTRGWQINMRLFSLLLTFPLNTLPEHFPDGEGPSQKDPWLLHSPPVLNRLCPWSLFLLITSTPLSVPIRAHVMERPGFPDSLLLIGFLFFIFLELGIKLRTSHSPGRHHVAELYPWPPTYQLLVAFSLWKGGSMEETQTQVHNT